MTFLELVGKRQSTREFLDRPVEPEKIERCVEAARLAPSACNSQPGKFIVVDEPKLRTAVAQRLASPVFGINAFAAKAPVLVAVVTEPSTLIARLVAPGARRIWMRSAWSSGCLCPAGAIRCARVRSRHPNATAPSRPGRFGRPGACRNQDPVSGTGVGTSRATDFRQARPCDRVGSPRMPVRFLPACSSRRGRVPPPAPRSVHRP
jgi:hypothetical protein